MWFFVQNGSQKGPVSLEEIQSLVNQGTISPATLVWKQGMDNWLVITQTELKNLFPDNTPPPIPDDIPPPIPTGRSRTVVREQKLEPVRLMKDSFTYTGAVYFPMLAFFVPTLVFNILSTFALIDGSNGTLILLSIINFTCVIPFVTGASIFYVHKNLTQQGVTIADSMQKATQKFSQLVLATVILWLILIPAFICLFIPALYLSIRLSFIYYAVIIENRSAANALSRSWKLTKGFWWQIFSALLILVFVIFIALFILAMILGILFGAGDNPFLSNTLAGLVGLLTGPIIAIYYVFIFMSLVNLAQERRNNRQVI